MTIPIVFFSASNNTKYVASLIAEGVKSEGLQPIIIPVERASEHLEEIQRARVVAIGAPIHGGFAEPALEWLKSFNDWSQKRVYLFSTAAYFFFGSAAEVASIIRKRGGIVSGNLELKFTAPGDGIYLLEKMVKRFPLRETELRRAFDFGREMAKACSTGPEMRQSISFSPMKILWGSISLSLVRLIKGPFLFAMKHLFFEFDIEKCVACRRCEQVCPKNAVTIKEEPAADEEVPPNKSRWKIKQGKIPTKEIPISLSDCFACFRCFKVCPTMALRLRFGRNLQYYRGPWQLEGYIDPEDAKERLLYSNSF